MNLIARCRQRRWRPPATRDTSHQRHQPRTGATHRVPRPVDYRNHRSKQKIDTKFSDAAGRRWPRTPTTSNRPNHHASQLSTPPVNRHVPDRCVLNSTSYRIAVARVAPDLAACRERILTVHVLVVATLGQANTEKSASTEKWPGQPKPAATQQRRRQNRLRADTASLRSSRLRLRVPAKRTEVHRQPGGYGPATSLISRIARFQCSGRANTHCSPIQHIR